MSMAYEVPMPADCHYMTVAECLWENAQRHVANGNMHLAGGNSDWAWGSYRKALRNAQGAINLGLIAD